MLRGSRPQLTPIVQDDIRILIRTATLPRLSEDPTVLGAFMKTDGWQTLLTFARESTRELFLHNVISSTINDMPISRSSNIVSPRTSR